MTASSLQPHRFLTLLPRIVAIAVIGVGGLVEVGLILNSDLLKGLVPGFATMQFDTALCFLLSGVALLLIRSGSPKLVMALGTVVALLSLLCLAEHFFGWNLGIDHWFEHEALEAAETFASGQMSIVTALNFLLIGSSLVLTAGSRRLTWAQVFAVGAAFTAALSLVGYWYGVQVLYQFGVFEPIALPSAVTFVILCLGIFFVYPERGLAGVIVSDHAGGLLARRLLPVAIFLPLVIGWLRLKGIQGGVYDLAFGQAWFALSNLVVFTTVILWTARSLNRLEAARNQAVKDLSLLNKQLETRVQESEAKFSTAFRASPAAISIATLPDGRWIEINEALAEMSGYSSDELIGHTSAELGLVDDVARTKILESMRAQGFIHDVEIQIYTKSKKIIDVLVSTKQTELNGKLCALTIQYDITERKRAENALRESEQKLRTFFELLPVGVSVIDGTWQVIEMNPALGRIMDMSMQGILSGE